MSKVWFITGASSGLGRALAQAVLDRGDRLAAAVRDPASIADLLAGAPDRARAVPFDAADPARAEPAWAEALAYFGQVDVLVNNAGAGLLGALEECDPDQLRRCLEVNFVAPMLVLRAAAAHFRARRAGRIVNISAAAAISNYPGFAAYGAAKRALEGLSESLAAELAPLGVKVIIVQPGPFRTDFIARSMDRARQRISDYDATSGRFAALINRMNGQQPGDPARAAELLCRVVDEDQPPLRLVLGKYAIAKARKAAAQAEADLKAWESAGAATEFPPAPR